MVYRPLGMQMTMLLRFASAKGKKLDAPLSDDRAKLIRERRKSELNGAGSREVEVDIVSARSNPDRAANREQPRPQTAGGFYVRSLVVAGLVLACAGGREGKAGKEDITGRVGGKGMMTGIAENGMTGEEKLAGGGG